MPAYTRPAYNAANATFSGAAAYTLPANDEADATWYEGDAFGYVAVPGPLGAPSVRAHSLHATISIPGILGTPSVLARTDSIARILVPGPLGAPSFVGFHDFTDAVQNAATWYVADLVTPGGLVRVPVSSWQGTLQTDRECFLTCVVPNCSEWLTSIGEATEFVISRQAVLPDGSTFENEVSRSPLETVQTDRGPTNYTATLSGYFAAYQASENPPEALDRVLEGVRSISVYDSGIRVRCAIDWTLRPGMRAIYADTSFVVVYMNLYGVDSDQYMDIGSREGA
jgi:hypothetical protein